jgi:hypothetical protein
MLRLLKGDAMAKREDLALSVDPDSDAPVMTPELARVFARIFKRLITEEAAADRRLGNAA